MAQPQAFAGRTGAEVTEIRYRKGDSIIARRQIEGMNVPEVPVGTVGRVESTTVLGKPKKVFFSLSTGWGEKRFTVDVRRGDVERVGQAR
jgi:hypothetical protein